MDEQLIENGKYEAGKPFRMQGVDYRRGDIVDTSKIDSHKIAQMLNQRMLRPAGLTVQPSTTPETGTS